MVDYLAVKLSQKGENSVSKYLEITTQIKDKDHICTALEAMEIPYEVAPEGKTLILSGYGSQRHAEVVVRRRSAEALRIGDMGWMYDSDNGVYRLVVDDMDQQKLTDVINGVNRRAQLLHLQEMAYVNGFALNVIQDQTDVQRVLVVEG